MIPGLRYLPGYLDAPVHDRLLAAADQESWFAAGGRRMQIYGWTYDGGARRMVRSHALPGWARTLAARLHRDGVTPFVADQLIVNEYQPGQGIRPHVDLACFDDTIVSLSLGSSCVVGFSSIESGATTDVFVGPASALVLSGEARLRWRHYIPPRAEDRWEGALVPRRRRVSLTFRRMLGPA